MIDGKTLEHVDATKLRSEIRRFGQCSSRHGGKLRIVFEGACAQEWYRRAEPYWDIAKLRLESAKERVEEWVNPNEPDAEIMKMKSGGTDMAHKAEHLWTCGEGAVIAGFTEARRVTSTKEPTGYAGKRWQSNLQELANNAEYCDNRNT